MPILIQQQIGREHTVTIGKRDLVNDITRVALTYMSMFIIMEDTHASMSALRRSTFSRNWITGDRMATYIKCTYTYSIAIYNNTKTYIASIPVYLLTSDEVLTPAIHEKLPNVFVH